MDQNALKALVGQEAVKYVQDGMILGIGTGSTVRYMIDALGERVKNEGLNIVGVATSDRSAKQAESLGITIKQLDEVDHLDLTIDGADEIDDNFQGIKGGGAAHLWEKIVAINSTKNMWIVDESKMVHHLGKFPLPLEVIPFGSSHVLEKLDKMGFNPSFRMKEDGSHVLTDSKNYIIDLHLGRIDHPHELANTLNGIVGVVEHGLFLDTVNTVIVGRQDGPEVLNARD
ncbi:MAG: ribose-5-phosphate isomerase RpiA [Levilactobacillus sp.]|jgi:ribose 5-phosphate isomerase A|uniref:Ribose-5-phosphate isomerase A n=1 Tax=Levilactobacillus suantsaiihabitans TaxID=2487722 RepID=A0A4Z0J855_9LACO|nr:MULTISPECIES: ribose-5-phosphate isomerase RpiA [Levilactobacillus]MCH4124113.1 ribose-5-phosphate isomerase RpiA [Levilactobacillus sp.]MCI1554051.1 ribose-5-phosphate isomerase RpiA [Levilactobacillus sp.]MCI1598443.1 ribose-5-phosphate isomerase RpiA [Levilactobacillus sp.]MCI1605788.1 ribose-5-phosphate isomerase RpiA [Levilactobacillus sp.]TGD18451.1 ribose-5-phosphate isomerase RpiA [Levilactobacillus suantsaiihabitans]